jgi:hypothetical protein
VLLEFGLVLVHLLGLGARSSFLAEHEAGLRTMELCRKHGVSDAIL